MKALLEESVCKIGNVPEDKREHVDTPFIDEGREERYVTRDLPMCSEKSDADGEAGSKSPEKSGAKPNPKDSSTKVEAESGELASAAARVVMQAMYVARMARRDLLRAVRYLTTRITRWGKYCDKRFQRLIWYIRSSMPSMQIGFIGDPPESWS